MRAEHRSGLIRAGVRLPLFVLLVVMAIRSGTSAGEWLLGVLLAGILTALTIVVLRRRWREAWWGSPRQRHRDQKP